MSDIITTDRYSLDNRDFSLRSSFFNPLLGLSRKNYVFGGVKERFQDVFFAVRGQKTAITKADGSINFGRRIGYINADPKNGDKLGFSDYGLLMLPYALKVAINFLLISTVGVAIKKSNSTPIRVLCGFLAVPACALALSLQIASSVLDLVKNLLAVTIAALLILPLTLHAHYLSKKGHTVEPSTDYPPLETDKNGFRTNPLMGSQ